MFSWECWKHLDRRSWTSKECPSRWGMSMKWCCGNHLLQWQMTAQGSKSLKMGYQVGNSQENLTRSLCLIRVLYIQNTYGLCYILMSASFLTQGHHVVYMCPDVIFQIILLHSRPMTSHHVTCHVTAMSRASSLSLKRKRNIKSKEK